MAVQAAPDFTVRLDSGSTVTLSSLRGHPVWLNFWAISCESCIVDLQAMEEVYQQYKKTGLRVVAIGVESGPEAVDLARAVGVTYAIGLDANGTITRRYRVAVVPAHFWIDRSGIISDWGLGEVAPDVMAAAVRKIVGR